MPTRNDTNLKWVDDRKVVWTKITKNRMVNKSKLFKKPRTDAILIKKTGEMSYADILRSVKTDPKLEKMSKISRTQNGDLLLKLSETGEKSPCGEQAFLESSSWTIEEFHTMIENVATDANTKGPLIVGGDFNAWATEWGSKHTNFRGRMLLEAFASLKLRIANYGEANTYREAGMDSIIDNTFGSFSLLLKMRWWVSEEFIHSDYQAVVFDIKEHRMAQNLKLTGPWKENLFNKDAFDFVMNSANVNQGSAEKLTKLLIQSVANGCHHATGGVRK